MTVYVISKFNKRSKLEQAELSVCSETLLFLHLQTSPTYTSNSRSFPADSPTNHAREQWRAKRSIWSRGFDALDFALEATPRALALQRKSVRRLILETSSALAIWDVTGTIHVEQLTSMTQCRSGNNQRGNKLDNVFDFHSFPSVYCVLARN